jgi:outer membrane protein OmpA-like peptidoglycan-associated protein/tetratricopeptide (TPR) repeat protein
MKTTLIKNNVCAAFIVLSLSVSAQNKMLTRANSLYDSKSYADAIEKYEAVLRKDESNVDALKKLAECYRLTSNSKKAEPYYAALFTSNKASAEEVLNYVQVLFSNGKDSKAKEVLGASIIAEDSRTKNYKKGLENKESYFKDSSNVKIKRVSELNSSENDFSPVMFKNDLVFTSTRPRTQWIREDHSWSNKVYNIVYVAKKQGSGFSKPKEFSKEYSSNFNDGPVCFSSDGKTMLFTANSMSQNRKRTDKDIVRLQLFSEKYNAEENSFEGLEAFPLNSDTYSCAHPALSAEGSKLVFSSDMPGTLGGMDLWVCSLENGKWGKAENLGPNINTKGNEVFPTLGQDGTLYFSSNGWDGLGGLDLYSATASKDKWGAASNMNAPFNSPMDDFGISLDKESKTGYFSSNRNSKNADDDIYSFVRSNVIQKKTYVIEVRDQETKAAIAADLEVKQVKTGELTKLKKDDGVFEIQLLPETECILMVVADKYGVKSEKFTAASDRTTVFLKKEMDKNCINGIVLDKSKNNAPASDATVVIKDNVGAKVFEAVTGADGKYSKCDLDKEKSYTVTTSKPGGYFTKTEGIKVPTTEVKTTELEKIVVGKAIKIDNIYFDLGKANIRLDAANELDKTVLLLNDNPDIIVELSSHTDCRGSAASNLALSEARAKSSVAYIISKGINQKRISGKGYGESKLANTCACEGAQKSSCSENEHQQNRRTEFKVTGFAK